MIDIVITMAGKGTRLQPYTFEKPKCLVPINGKPLIEHQMNCFLQEYLKIDVGTITLVTGYMHDKIKKGLKKVVKNINYVVNTDYETTSCGYSMMLGLKRTKNHVIHFNGDLLFKQYLLKELSDTKHDNCICIKPLDCKFKLGEKTFVEDDIVKYIGVGNVAPYNAYAVGPTLLSRKGIENMISLYDELDESVQDSIHCLPLIGMFAEKYELYGKTVKDNSVIEINTNEDWKLANIVY